MNEDKNPPTFVTDLH